MASVSSLSMLPTKSSYDNCFFDNLYLEAASFYSDPDRYLEPTDTMRKEVLSLSKKMYDFMKEFEVYSIQNSLKELLVSGFDNEQIWQEIQLQNSPSLLKIKNSLKGLDTKDLYLNVHNNDEKMAKKTKAIKRKKETKPSNNLHKSTELSDEGSEVFDIGDEDIEKDDEERKEPKKKYKKTIVDDDFFHLREMEEYMDKLDRMEEMKNNEDVLDNDDESGSEIDFFNEKLALSDSDNDDDGDDEISVNALKYSDFFDPPSDSVKEKRNKDGEDIIDNGDIMDYDDEASGEYDDEEDDDEDNYEDIGFGENGEGNQDEINDGDQCEMSEGDGDSVVEGRDDAEAEKNVAEYQNQPIVAKDDESTFERKQRLMQEKIKKLEEENLNDKPWQLMGEADAKKRPINSLLEEFVTFDVTSVGAPVITEETTLSLEDLIKQRIKDKAWDDVIRKEKPLAQPFEYKKAPELNQEKSKLSLAEVYEKEYLKEAEDQKEDKENEEHVNIQNLMDRLFVQLDALSNFHFTPKPPQPEIKIITNVPSLQMEEVLPITMTESSQLAPEEVFEKKKGELVCADEKTDEDRKRDRRQKKIKKKFAAKDRERKEKLKAQKAGKVAKSEKKLAMDSLKKGVRNTIVSSSENNEKKGIKSSNEFFNKLQNEVKGNISKESLKHMAVQKKKKSAELLKL